MHLAKTNGKFGFHLDEGPDEHLSPVVRIFVKSSSLSRDADLSISPHLMTGREIDEFVDDAIQALEEVRTEAKSALARANSH